MQDRLEEFVKQNRDAFDSEVPGDALWGRIEEGLDEEKKVVPMTPAPQRAMWIWKAAVVVLLGAVSFLLVDRYLPRQQEEIAAVSTIEEFQDLESFYTSIISEKRGKLADELGEEKFLNYLETDIEELDAIYAELKLTFEQKQETPEVLGALIHLLRQKLHLINSQLDILEDAKNPLREREDEVSSI